MGNSLHRFILQDKLWFRDETDLCLLLQRRAEPLLDLHPQAASQAKKWIEQIRHNMHSPSNQHLNIESFLQSYSLDNEEGIRLMALAEALIRIPDNSTADALIESKLHGGHWHDHLQQELSPLLNAATRALLFAEQLVDAGHSNNWLLKLENKLGRPILREALRKGIQLLGQQFVMGETLAQALSKAQSIQRELSPAPITFSFDMLGEAALCQADVDTYFNAYKQAIHACAEQNSEHNPKHNTEQSILKPSVSIKLSALHPRLEWRKRKPVLDDLLPRLIHLCQEAAEQGVSITLDAEEALRLPLSQMIFAALLNAAPQADIGMAVQAYGKRAHAVLAWLHRQAIKHQKRLAVRLVKGAYWDSEIKWAQQQRLSHYPVFTHRDHTDISYLACARYMLDRPHCFYPQFATHNALTLALIWQYGNSKSIGAPINALTNTPGLKYQRLFEFQKLHGMGEPLYQTFYNSIPNNQPKPACRIYAPVGPQQELLPYLIRRLLENGANSSFAHQTLNDELSPSEIVQRPKVQLVASNSHPTLSPPPTPSPPILQNPKDLFPGRISASGYQMNIPQHEKWITHTVESFLSEPFKTEPSKPELQTSNDTPLDLTHSLFEKSQIASGQWSKTDVHQRAEIINKVAYQLEKHLPELVALCADETGKILQNGIDDVREAVDFCRYYALEAQRTFEPEVLPGITGERNQLNLAPRGTIVCISPWNFPVAIFCGQVVAALVTGNCVIAKPAEQSPRITKRVAELIHSVGLPENVLQLTFGEAKLGQALVSHPQTSGVIFTGSTAAAKDIQQRLAASPGPIVPFIAETGGINAMICDSSALADQVINDVLISAFDSAGQRCSALRRLYLPDTVSENWKKRLLGAMAELSLGDPSFGATDIGPLIDDDAAKAVHNHIQHLKNQGLSVHQASHHSVHQSTNQQHTHQGELSTHKNLCPPTLIELPLEQSLQQEVFAPVLHLTSYQPQQLSQVIEQINNSGYGLTLGIHSRNQDWIQAVSQQITVGNVYINRNIIGAEVGSQPFGGCGLSGTGPKAGGPHYLKALCREICVCENTTALGGNTELLSQKGP